MIRKFVEYGEGRFCSFYKTFAVREPQSTEKIINSPKPINSSCV